MFCCAYDLLKQRVVFCCGDYGLRLPLTRVRVSGGHLCEAEAPTVAAAETLSVVWLTEGEKRYSFYVIQLFLSFRLATRATSLVRGRQGLSNTQKFK